MVKKIEIKTIKFRNIIYKIYLEKRGGDTLKYYVIHKFKTFFNTVKFQWKWLVDSKNGFHDEISSYNLSKIINYIKDDLIKEKVKKKK
jgi:hypothetical protein